MIFNKIKLAYYDFFLHLIKGSESNETKIHDDELIESVRLDCNIKRKTLLGLFSILAPAYIKFHIWSHYNDFNFIFCNYQHSDSYDNYI